MDVHNIIIVFVAISFIAYGINSFISNKMILEFKRWGLEKKKKRDWGFSISLRYRDTNWYVVKLYPNY